MNKILVTGAAGFIGSTLVEALLQNPENYVIGIDSFTEYYDPSMKRSNLKGVGSPNFLLLEKDIRDIDLDELLSDVKIIYHLAGQPGVRRSWGTEFSKYVNKNIVATQLLLEAARHGKSLERFIYASSSSVYGDAETYPTYETDRPSPVSPYGVSKLAGENLVSLYGTAFDLPTLSLRFFTVYGPRQRPDMAFRRFIEAALDSRPLTIFGDGTQIREFTHVDDIVRALMLAAFESVEAGTVMNLSGGSSISVNDVVALLETLIGKAISVSRTGKVPGDVFQTGGSTDRAKTILRWSPAISIEEGLQSEIEWVMSTRESA